MADFEIRLTCRHCQRVETVTPPYSHHPTDKAIEQLKGWERAILPYTAGQPVLLCESCLVLLKSWMAEFVGAEPEHAPRVCIAKPGDRIFIRDGSASWLVMALRRQS